MKWLLLAAALISLGCYLTTAYEPCVCIAERRDGVLVIAASDTTFIGSVECKIWRALSDSTKCWDENGDALACP